MRLTPKLLATGRILILGLLATSLYGCDAVGPELSDLERARARWESRGLSDYTYAIRRLCFCSYVGPVRVTVENGAVVSLTPVGGEEPPFELTAELFPGVEGLFDILQEAVGRDAHSITVTYDPETGVPLEFFIDYDEFIADEELGMEVTESVTPLEAA
jgi:hypothetical protein